MTTIQKDPSYESGLAERIQWAVQDTVTMTWRDLIRTRR